jgi:mitogen-activated protein kinase 8 interacting protein 3
MGTGNGVIISVPLNHPQVGGKSATIEEALEGKESPSAVEKGAGVKVYADVKERLKAESFIPFCSMSQAQLSFHGHRDAVKFFVSVPGMHRSV